MKNAGALLILLLVGVQGAPAAVATGQAPRFVGCRSFFAPAAQGVVRPRSIVVACGDGNFYLAGIAWSRWAPMGAQGVGVAHQNDCVPYCAAGHFHAYPVDVRLGRVLGCGAAKLPQFTRVLWQFTAAKPAGVPRSGSETFRCRKG